MKNKFNKMLFLLMIVSLCFSACSKNSANDEEDDLGFFASDRDRAVKLIDDANEELKRIKILYTENREKLEELKTATKAQDSAKVKEVSNDLVYIINDGFVFADSARSKLQEAQELNIEPEFKEYLGLKEEGLQRQIEAFKFLHEAARGIRDSFGSGDKDAIENARQNFLEKEKSFQAKMQEAGKVSTQADDFAKEANNKKPE